MNRKQLIFPLLRQICSEEGIKFIEEPTRGVFGVLLFSNRNFYIKDINFNLNNASSAALCTNKAATAFFLDTFGYNTPKFTFVAKGSKHVEDSIESGLEFANSIGFPVVIKPNCLSQGRLVFKIFDSSQYMDQASRTLSAVKSFLLQEHCIGNDYRIVILDGKLLCAYQRIPLHVLGDGINCITDLVRKKQHEFEKIERDTIIDFNDERIFNCLKNQNMNYNFVPQKNEKIFLQDISNLSAGGETIELTDKIHESYVELACHITHDFNLKLCGVDIITADISKPLSNYYILELNSSPGLDNYAYTGKKQEEYVKSLYRKVLLSIKNDF